MAVGVGATKASAAVAATGLSFAKTRIDQTVKATNKMLEGDELSDSETNQSPNDAGEENSQAGVTDENGAEGDDRVEDPSKLIDPEQVRLDALRLGV